MDIAGLETLRQRWQKAVSEHAGILRDGRMSGLNSEKLGELSRSYVLRIDLAYTRLMEAEARERLTARPR